MKAPSQKIGITKRIKEIIRERYDVNNTKYGINKNETMYFTKIASHMMKFYIIDFFDYFLDINFKLKPLYSVPPSLIF